MHSIYAALLEAVLATPSNPVPKLVLADWLDEQDEWRLARAYRWCAENLLNPMPSVAVKGDWVWFNIRSDTDRIYQCAELPHWLHRRMIQGGTKSEVQFGQIRSHSFTEAMQAIADHLEPIE